MVEIHIKGPTRCIYGQGWDKLWSLSSRLEIPLPHIRDIHADSSRLWAGFRDWKCSAPKSQCLPRGHLLSTRWMGVLGCAALVEGHRDRVAPRAVPEAGSGSRRPGYSDSIAQAGVAKPGLTHIVLSAHARNGSSARTRVRELRKRRLLMSTQTVTQSTPLRAAALRLFNRDRRGCSLRSGGLPRFDRVLPANLLFLGFVSFAYDANVHTPPSPWGPFVILVPVLGARRRLSGQ